MYTSPSPSCSAPLPLQLSERSPSVSCLKNMTYTKLNSVHIQHTAAQGYKYRIYDLNSVCSSWYECQSCSACYAVTSIIQKYHRHLSIESVSSEFTNAWQECANDIYMMQLQSNITNRWLDGKSFQVPFAVFVPVICKCKHVRHLPSWLRTQDVFVFCVCVFVLWFTQVTRCPEYIRGMWIQRDRRGLIHKRKRKRSRPLRIHNLALTDRWYWRLNAEGGCF